MDGLADLAAAGTGAVVLVALLTGLLWLVEREWERRWPGWP